MAKQARSLRDIQLGYGHDTAFSALLTNYSCTCMLCLTSLQQCGWRQRSAARGGWGGGCRMSGPRGRGSSATLPAWMTVHTEQGRAEASHAHLQQKFAGTGPVNDGLPLSWRKVPSKTRAVGHCQPCSVS